MTIRQIEVSADWVRDRELGALPKVLRAQKPYSGVRELQGSVVFVLPEIEDQAEEIFDVPGVLDWFRRLHDTIPHVTYFMNPDPWAGALRGLVLARLGTTEFDRDHPSP